MITEIIKVDVVGLPKLTIKELELLKNNFNENEALSDGQKGDSISEKKGRVDNNEMENNTKVEESALSLINKLSQEVGVKGKKSTNVKKLKKSGSGRSKKLQKLLFEGNKISKGSSISGRYQGDVAQFDQYVLNLPNLIRPYWKLPSFLKEANFKARIIVYINSNGRVIHHRFVSSSGNEEFDSRALKSINDSQPFPLPNAEIKDRLLSEGVILGFPL